MFSPKIEIINHFDELFNRLNNEIEQCLEKYKKDELLDQKISCKFRNRELRNDRKFVVHLCNWLEKNKEETEDKSTKIGDYLKTVRMRTIEELRKEQKESFENSSKFNHLKVAITNKKQKEELKSQLFADKFYFQVKITPQKNKLWYFNLFTFVTDFFMSQSEITFLEKMINAQKFKIESLFRNSKHIFNDKTVLIGLLFEYFWKNITTRKLPNQMIYVSKQDLSKIENIYFEYPISGVNLNGSLTYLSKLKHLFLDISNGVLEEVRIENLPSLKQLRLKSESVKRISLKSLNGLKILFLDINFLETKLQRDFFDQIPNIEQLHRNNLDFFSFTFYKLEEKLCIHKLKVDYFSSMSLIFNQIEKLSIKCCTDKHILSKLLCASDNFRNLLELDINDCEVTKIDKKMFYGLDNLRSLSLNCNRIRIISSDAFSNLKQLVNLDLSSNIIESIDKMAFSKLVNLESLNLSGNRLKNLHENIFSNVKNLRQLDLESNELEKLNPRLFFGLENLCELNLTGNKLTHIDHDIFSNLSALDDLPQLKDINNPFAPVRTGKPTL